MKRLLVLSDPPAAPGYLPRLRYLCDYLVQKGYGVTLVTERYQDLPFEHTYPIITIPMYRNDTWDWFFKTAYTLLTDWHNRAFARKIINNKLTNHTFDAVLCSAFSDFPLGAAKILAEHYHVPLICDIRDLDEQVDDSRYQYRHQAWWTMPFRRLYRAIHIRRRNKVLKAADAITTVSPWHTAFIQPLNHNVHTVYNGFDEQQFYPEDIQTNIFKISYIGSLFDWQKGALAIVRQVVEELNQSHITNEPSQIILDIHTPKSEPIPYTRLGDAIRQSSIMLVLTSTRTRGMMTTKFYEALGCEKPILCVPSDNGCLADTIQRTNAGIATDSAEDIKAFIMAKYHEWQKNGFTRQPVNCEEKNQFARHTQTRKIEQLI